MAYLENFALNKADLFMSNSKSIKQTAINSGIFAIFAGLCFMLFSVIILVRSVTRPLQKLIEHSAKWSEGELIPFSDSDRKDEIGQLTKALNNVMSDFKEVIVATQTLMNKTSETLNICSAAVKDISNNISSQASYNSNLASKISDTAADSQENLTNLKKIDEAIHSTRIKYVEGAHVIQENSGSLRSIGQNISSIDEISQQTQILSINASVEAARSGEYGKSFGVVAQEIGKLAKNTLQYSTQIHELTKNSNEISDQSDQVLMEMAMNIEQIVSAGESIRTKNEEFALKLDEINGLIQSSEKISMNSSVSAEQLASSY